MIAIWQLVLKALGTSFLALLAVGTITPIIKFLLTKTRFNAVLIKNKRAVYFILVLVIFSIPIAFSLVTKQELFLVLIAFIRELIFSVIIVFTVWITWAFAENPKKAKQDFLVALLRILVNVKQKKFLRGIRVIYSDEKALDFFVIEYWHLRKILQESTFNDCLNICQISVQYPPTEQELVIYDIHNLEDSRFISIEDHVFVVSPEKTMESLSKYNDDFEISVSKTINSFVREMNMR